MTYIVSCSECTLRDEIGDSEAVLELQEHHRAKYGPSHILEFHLVH